MGIQIRREVVKKKDKRLPDRVGMIASGPPELFTNDVLDRLAIAGFRKVKPRGETYKETWRLAATVGATPDHLLRTLSTVIDVYGDPAVERAVEMGTRQGSGQGAGASPLCVKVLGPYFCANCEEDNKPRRAFLEGAGFFPLFQPGVPGKDVLIKAFGDFPYVSQDGIIAANLLPWMDAAAKTALLDRMKEEKVRISRSGVKQRVKGDPVIPMPEGEALQGFQDAGVNNLLRTRKSGVIYDDMGLGKAQPLFSMITTPYGKKLMGDIKVGDEVIGSDGKPALVTGVFPQGVKEIFKVTFSDGSGTHCCDDHLWAVNTNSRKRKGQPWKILPLKDIKDKLKDRHGNNQQFIPMVQPVEFEEKKLPIAPYLLGVLLGDGGISRNCVRLTTTDEEILQYVKEDLPLGIRIRHIQRYDYGLVSPSRLRGSNPITGALRSMGLLGKGSDNKFIPNIYLLGSVEQRIALLQGLLDTDGWIARKNRCIGFSSNSLDLANGVVEIVQSLGGNALKKKYISESGKNHYRVVVILPDKFKPFRLTRKLDVYKKRTKKPSRAIVSVESVGFYNAQCISVDAPDRLYVTDDYIVTHNTVQGIAYANARTDLPRVLVCCKANMKYGWKTSFERFSTRPHNAFVIEGISATITDPKTGEVRSATPRPETLIPAGRPAPENHDMVDVVIINYDILTHHADFIRNTQWDLVIQDEIHSVSNEEAQRTRIIFGDMKDKVKKPVGLRLTKDGVSIGLSGTPHPVVERMWPILSGLRPDVFGAGPYAKRLFIQRYAPPTLFVKEFPNGGKRVMAIPGRPIRQAELNRRLRGSGFMTRRLKADMKDFLPPKSRAAIELPFTLTPEETKELSQLEGQILEVVAKVAERSADRGALVKNEGRASAIIDVVTGLHPKSPEFHEISRLRSRIGEIKAPYVAEYVMEETEGEEDLPADVRPKTVIFAHHKAVIGSIRAALETRYPGQVIVYDGSVTSDKKRFELEKKFQTDDKIRFFVMSLSGASGITLTRANRLYMAEMDWDPTNLPQIEDRIWRMTQELPCFIGYFMVPNSLDVQMGNRLIQRMEDNRLIYDEIDLRPGVKTETGFTKKKALKNEAQGELPL